MTRLRKDMNYITFVAKKTTKYNATNCTLYLCLTATLISL